MKHPIPLRPMPCDYLTLAAVRFTAREIRLNGGGYSSEHGGRYFGHGQPLWEVTTCDRRNAANSVYTVKRAPNKIEAIADDRK